MAGLTEDVREGIVLVGATLGPLFLNDPKLDAERIAPIYTAFKNLDVEAAACDWPFVTDDTAFTYLSWMNEGLDKGIDNEDLMWEFRRLFIGPDTKPAPPWGSVYMDKDKVCFGSSCMGFRDWLKRVGVSVEKKNSDEPEDHLGTMLELMAWLSANRPELLEEYLQEHLLTWSSHFLEQLERASEHPFFRGLAGLTRVSLEGIQETLGLVIDYPEFYR